MKIPKQRARIEIHRAYFEAKKRRKYAKKRSSKHVCTSKEKRQRQAPVTILGTRVKVSNGAKIRNRYNQVPHLTQDTNGKVTNSQKTPQTRAKRSALSQQVTTKHI